MKYHKYLVQIQAGGAQGIVPDKFADTIQWAIHRHLRQFFGNHTPEITVTREEVPAPSPTPPAQPLAKTDLVFPDTTKLGDLTPNQLDNLCLGLTHTFGATLWVLGTQAERCFFVEMEDQRRVAFEADCRVDYVWGFLEFYDERPITTIRANSQRIIPVV